MNSYNSKETKNNIISANSEQNHSYCNNFFKNNNTIMLVINSETAEIVDANMHACSFYQYSYEDMLKLEISDINILSKEQIAFEMKNASTQQKNCFYFKHRLASGEIRDVEVHSGPITQGSKKLLYSIIHDITERKKAEEEMVRTNKELQEKVEMSTRKLQETNVMLEKKIAECEKNMEALKASEERFSNVLKNSQDASYRKNLVTNKYDYISPVIEKITGYSQEEIIEMTLEDVIDKIHQEDLPNILKHINDGILESDTPETLEYRFLCKNGNYRWIIDRFTAIKEASSHSSFCYGVFQDITELKLAEEELKKAKEAAEKASANKSEFIANMSHELRTPLNVNISAIQLFELYLKDSSELDKGKIAKHLMPMKRNCLRLLRLVNNLIDSTKIDAGFYEPHFSNENIVGVIERIAMSVSEYAKQKNIDLIFDTDVEEILIPCDIDIIERIMLNLISNAIKFTKDCVNINIYNKVDTIIIAVKDNGIGIENENKNIIFERYKQVSKLFTRETEGTGIGLALTKALVEMHHGSISVKSDYGNGSEFIIELPVNKHISEEVLLGKLKETPYDEIFIEKMNVEFSDIYK